MPLVDIQLIEGVFDKSQKQDGAGHCRQQELSHQCLLEGRYLCPFSGRRSRHVGMLATAVQCRAPMHASAIILVDSGDVVTAAAAANGVAMGKPPAHQPLGPPAERGRATGIWKHCAR